MASAQYLLNKPRNRSLSRLSLAVVTGVLQSVVDATPQHVGQTHLRYLYDDLHALEEVGHLSGAAKYYTSVTLSENSQQSLAWWIAYLQNHPGATTCTSSAEGLVLKWGDGSGTGTGGTTEFYPIDPNQPFSPNIELWMGVWQPHCKVTSSNWKELRTVLQSLQQEVGKGRVQNTTVFYFTDNLVSYYVVSNGSSRSPGLQKLVEEVKDVEAQLGCHLEIVHVPGTLMIHQGTDGLSRGLWLAPECRLHGINQHLFQAVPYTTALGSWAVTMVGLRPSTVWQPVTFTHNWRDPSLKHGLSIWTPPPECARQAITTYLSLWVQCSYDTSAIFLIPRILQKQWSRIISHIRELGIFYPSLLPPQCAYEAYLPFVFLYLPPFHLTLSPRLDLPSPRKPKNWHHRQAEEVRGLS